MLADLAHRLWAEHPEQDRLRSARLLAIAAIAARVAATAATLAFLWLLARAIDAVFTGSVAPGDLVGEFAWLGLALLARGAAMWCASICIGRAGDSVQHVLREVATAAALDTLTQDVGETTGVLLDGVADIRAWVVDYLPVTAMAALAPAMAFLVVAVLDPLTTLILLFTGPMLLLLLAVIGRRTAELTRRRAEELGWLRSFYLDLLEGLPTLKLFGASRDGAALVEGTSRRFADTTMEVLRTAFQTSLVMEWASTAATALVAVEVSLRMTTGNLDFATALTVLMIVPEFFVPFRHVALAYHAGSSGDAASQRVRELLRGRDLITGSTDGPGSPPIEQDAIIEATAESAGLRVEFRDVTFSYPGRPRPAVEGLDLIIESGETVALCGPSGAGKSTVLSLLMGFTHPHQGSILANGLLVNSAVVNSAVVNGVTARSARLSVPERVSAERWRQLVSWVPQHPTLFSGTVAENIAFGEPLASAEQIRRAARSAGVIDYVESLPDGFDTVLGEGGHNLSGGQRQRIAVARAHLRDAPLVLLDEFTSHVDPQTESVVLDATEQLLADRTAIVIAHRRSTARQADRVVFLEHGSVVDAGPAAEVLERHPSWDPPLHGTPPLHDPPPLHAAAASGNHRSVLTPDVLPRRSSTRHLMAMMHGHRGWVAATTVLSAATIASGIGLMALAAWLISRAAELDSTATLALGITAVRLFAVSRVALRYAERLVGHIGTFGWVTTLRVRFFNALEALAPLTQVGGRRGDLLARVLVDIDAVGDLPLRVVVPFAAATVVLVGSVILLAGFSVPAAAVTGIALVVLGLALPRVTRRATRPLSVDAAAVRGRLEGALVESLSARVELVAWGRQDRLTAATESASEQLDSIHRARTRATGDRRRGRNHDQRSSDSGCVRFRRRRCRGRHPRSCDARRRTTDHAQCVRGRATPSHCRRGCHAGISRGGPTRRDRQGHRGHLDRRRPRSGREHHRATKRLCSRSPDEQRPERLQWS